MGMVNQRLYLHFLFGVLMLFGIKESEAQTYTLTVTSEPYQSLQGGQALVNDFWDDPSFTVPLGFNFEFFNEMLQSVVVDASFSFVSMAAPPVDDMFSLLIPFGADLVDRGYLDSVHLSPIRYKVTGSPGSKVLTVEWSNAGYFQDLIINGTSTDYINFQVRLYEANGDIEYHYGPNAVADPPLVFNGEPGPVVGIAEQYNPGSDMVLGEVLLLSGDPAVPGAQTDYQNYTLDGPPPENTVYRFSREQTGIFSPGDIHYAQLFGPNPTSGTLHVLTSDLLEPVQEVHVYDFQGRCILRSEGQQDIVLNGWPSGLYELRIFTPSGIKRQRISLQASF